jgi:ribosomal protein S18 acetylase RimI-like enzyme
VTCSACSSSGDAPKARARRPNLPRTSAASCCATPRALLLAETDDGEIVGSLIVGWNGWRGSFYRMAVDPSHRRGGLATALVRAGEERLRALGARRLDAIVETHEPGAMAFWASAGYELQTSRSRFVKNLL